MPRADLIALSPDDLAALTNRGTVKRVQRELEGAEVTGEIEESADGSILAKWSDGVACVLPGGKVLAESRCTCPATELCRHIIRTVLAYQVQSSKSQTNLGPASWNPGDIRDEELANHFKPGVLSQCRTQFHSGLLIEIVKGIKPTARFHDLACTLRFQVPGDVRYVHCDCNAEAPCIHVPLAVWAFRRLPIDKNSAIVSTQEKPLPVPLSVLDHIDEVLLEGLEFGLAGAGDAWRDRLSRLETQCRKASLIWPAEVLVEIVYEFQRYAEHDACFNPERFAELVGELLIRSDAIRKNTGAVPQLLIRGTASDHWNELGGSRFIGLGCGVQRARRSVTLTAFLQDANSGSMVAVRREFPDPATDSKDLPKNYGQLAQMPVLKGASFAQVGAGQLLTQGGKRAASHELVLGRAKATVNPQNFSWENLRAPVLAENFAEIRERLRILPPTSLRPRRVAEDFHVCAIKSVERVSFDASRQIIQAYLKDAGDDVAVLRHPYFSRGGEGAELLLAALSSNASAVRFVAGPMRTTSDGLCVEPVAVVLEGAGRTAIQPWIDRNSESQASSEQIEIHSPSSDPVESLGKDLLGCVSELMIVGLKRADAGILRSWKELEHRIGALGLARFASAIHPIVAGLVQKDSMIRWPWQPTGQALLEVAVLARMMRDLGQ